jgi:hypothetical protein
VPKATENGQELSPSPRVPSRRVIPRPPVARPLGEISDHKCGTSGPYISTSGLQISLDRASGFPKVDIEMLQRAIQQGKLSEEFTDGP